MITQLARNLLIAFAFLSLASCAILGPAAIRAGRPAYNEAIIATNNQQVLGMIVRFRYGEPSGLLAVSSVTANMRFQANIDAQFGYGPESGYAGNLVPLSVGAAYEENPTISYSPVQGEKYLRQVLSPLPLDLTVLLLSSLRDSPQALTLLVRSINGIRNPDFLTGSSVEPDPRFTRIAELLSELGREGLVTWAQEPGETTPSFVLVHTGEGDDFARRVRELYGLLGFDAPRNLDGVITLPVRLGLGKPDKPGINLDTRSLFDLFNIAAASVDVPPEHLESGMARPLPHAGPAGQCIRIRRTKNSPDGAMTAVRHHGWWYSIDGTDAASKMTFRMVDSLMSVRMAEAAEGKQATPILTVPVSR